MKKCRMKSLGENCTLFTESQAIAVFHQILCSYTDINIATHFYQKNGQHVSISDGKPYSINPLPHMPISGSSNSAANKNMITKIWTNRDTII